MRRSIHDSPDTLGDMAAQVLDMSNEDTLTTLYPTTMQKRGARAFGTLRLSAN